MTSRPDDRCPLGWSGAVSFGDLVSSVRAPYAQPGSVKVPAAVLDWSTVERVLAVIDEPNALVVAQGSLVAAPVPRTRSALDKYLRHGVGLCLRRTELYDPALSAIQRVFLPFGDAHVQLFITPSDTHGFRWHYDDEHVFIAHTLAARSICFARTPWRRSSPRAATCSAPTHRRPRR